MTAVRLPDGSIDCANRRLQREFLSMPALCLTVAQAARLADVPVAAAARLLADLEHNGILVHMPGGRYRLAEPGGMSCDHELC